MKKTILPLFLLLSATVWGQQTNDHFQHTEITAASSEAIWRVWTDVPNWHQWDEGLKSARLDGAFRTGAKGWLIPNKGPKSKFVITAIEPNKSYVFKTKIPFGWLVVERRLESNSGLTRFTHEVQFTGILKKFFGKRLGKNYRAMLPNVMQSIAKIAEKQ